MKTEEIILDIELVQTHASGMVATVNIQACLYKESRNQSIESLTKAAPPPETTDFT